MKTKDIHAVELGRKGGLAKWKGINKKKRKEIMLSLNKKKLTPPPPS